MTLAEIDLGFARRQHVDETFLARLTNRLTLGAGSRPQIEVLAPATGRPLGVIPDPTEVDVDEAVRRARLAQREWSTRPLRERCEVFLRFHDLVLDRRDEALEILELETGKTRKNAFEEVFDTANVARYYARTAAKHLGVARRMGAVPLLTQTREHHRPLGVVGFIVPWNYPLVLGITDAIPALIAGNAAVVKPDPQTPYSALWAADLLDQVGLPREVLHVVAGDGAQLGTPLIDRVDYVMFTGSTRVGRIVARQCGERLIGCSMELGGKNSMIVLDDADLGRTVLGAQRACFSNAGQLCIGMERVFVHDGLFDEFTARFAEDTRRMKLGSGAGADMGTLISRKQLESVSEHVDDATAKGARVVTGGRARPELGPFFYEPTILTDVAPDMTLYAEETFGPVVALYRWAEEEDLLARVNGTRYGLNASIWTRDGARARSLGRCVEAGTVNVNEGYGAAWGSTDATMGGLKDSGVGRRHGAQGIQKYTETQTIAVQRLLPLEAPRRLPERHWERYMSAALRALRRVPAER